MNNSDKISRIGKKSAKLGIKIVEAGLSIVSETAKLANTSLKKLDTSIQNYDNNQKIDENSIFNLLTNKVKQEVTEIKDRTDLTEDEKVDQIKIIASTTCAGIAIQPIPFADIFILTPLQAYFSTIIASIRGVPVSESNATQIIKEIVGIVGIGVTAQQAAIGIFKFIPGYGSIVSIPVVFSLSYAIMSVADAYFKAKKDGKNITSDEIKKEWAKAQAEAKKKEKTTNRDNSIQNSISFEEMTETLQAYNSLSITEREKFNNDNGFKDSHAFFIWLRNLLDDDKGAADRESYSQFSNYVSGMYLGVQGSITSMTLEELEEAVEAYSKLSEEERKEFHRRNGFENTQAVLQWFNDILDEDEEVRTRVK